MNQTITALLQLRSPRSLVIGGLSLLGSASLLNGGMGLAQGSAVELVIPESTAPASLSTVVPAPPQSAPAAPESFAPEAAPARSLPAATPPLTLTPTMVAPVQTEASYEAPATIVFSERSTGCQATISTGQAINDVCPPPAPAPVASGGAVTWQGGLPAVRVAALGDSPARSLTTMTPSLRDYYNRTKRPPGRLGNGNIRLIFPLSMPAVISSAFGWRIHPISGDQRFHSGTDLAAPLGTPVLAAYAGQVAIADFLSGYGLTVTLEHNKGTQETLYAHLSEIFVQPGEWVKQGDVIGRVGSTGNSTGPHLHFEFRQLTTDGWVAMDAGEQLEYALAQLLKSMQVAQAKPVKAKGV